MLKTLFIVLLALNLTNCKGQDAKNKISETNYELLQGTWEMQEDKKSKIIIKDRTYYDYYDGKLLEQMEYSLKNSCSVSPNDFNKNGSHMIINLEGENLCYEIMGIDNKTLSIMYLDNGKVFVYNKVDNYE